MTSPREPTIGLLPWGNVLEDFLEPSGLTLERFTTEFTGSWIFGWTRALATAGVRTEVVCISREARAVTRTLHGATATPVVVVPTTRAYRALARRMTYPYGRTARAVFGSPAEPRGAKRLALEVAREIAPYTATPPLRIARAARRDGWRAVLCQEYESPRFDVSVLLGRVLSLPVYACFQGGNYRLGRLEGVLRPPAIARAAGLIAGPEREVRRVRELYGAAAGEIARIFNPVDLAAWRPRDRAAARAELGLPADAPVVAWHGRVAIDHKGLDILLEAWRAVTAGRGDEPRLLLVGSGQDAAELDRIVQRDAIPGVVRVDRYVHDPHVLSRHLCAADVYAFPSRHEGFPVAPIEALACGLPVVAADVAGVREILPEGEASGGVVVPVRDPAALAQALTRLLDDAALRGRLAQAALERARGAFSLEAVGAQLRELILGDRPPAAR